MWFIWVSLIKNNLLKYFNASCMERIGADDCKIKFPTCNLLPVTRQMCTRDTYRYPLPVTHDPWPVTSNPCNRECKIKFPTHELLLVIRDPLPVTHYPWPVTRARGKVTRPVTRDPLPVTRVPASVNSNFRPVTCYPLPVARPTGKVTRPVTRYPWPVGCE